MAAVPIGVGAIGEHRHTDIYEITNLFMAHTPALPLTVIIASASRN